MVMVHLDRAKSLQAKQTTSVFWDMIMLVVVSINLTWLVIDALYAHPVINSGLQSFFPQGHGFYGEHLHSNFAQWDLAFVALYLTEIVCRWVTSIFRKTYYRWWFYPFVHWYDVLGSLPLPGFRALRLFRLVSLLYRLQQYGILDFSQTFIYRFCHKYFLALVEEVSDRVVISVLDGVEEELRAGNPVTHRVMTQVIAPRREELGQWLGDQITDLIEHSYLKRQTEVAHYIRRLVHEGVKDNPEVSNLARIPALGGYITETLEKAIADITHGALEQLALDLHGEGSTGLIHEASEVLFENLSEPGGPLSQLLKGVMLDLLEVVKAEVRIQKWKSAPPL